MVRSKLEKWCKVITTVEIILLMNSMIWDFHAIYQGGAFYVFPDISSTGLSSEEFAEKLLIDEQVAVVPGSVFGKGGEGYIRCSYVTRFELLQEAMQRIKRFIDKDIL